MDFGTEVESLQEDPSCKKMLDLVDKLLNLLLECEHEQKRLYVAEQ